MTKELIKQRIEYLVTHGGLYPEGRPLWMPWVVAGIALQVATLGVILLR
ncbi:hypothetical protein UFOVP61_16 [uncultured Caudovirales phage]|uniref:Uncharacterized protein n=1 Tax=uncultured Caudovirales phage TaxID=2100421 RepID=A0A6J5KQ92_9CAUD|nr:hypothetical protein UFOVP61_16 [uncultured Caudovirales phage]